MALLILEFLFGPLVLGLNGTFDCELQVAVSPNDEYLCTGGDDQIVVSYLSCLR